MDIFEDFVELFDNDLVEIFNVVNRDRREYTVRPRPDNLNMWDENEFIRRFRVSKNTVRDLLVHIEDNLRHHTDRNNAISPLSQLLLALRFLASGSFYIAIADFGGIHKSTAGQIIHRVVNALAELRENYVHFPQTPEEKNNTIVEFSRFARLPRVLGAIDCTHIKLQSPGGPNAENFRNRKGYFSLNVQAVCNAKCHITDIVVRWPGSAHDTHIFNNSAIRMRFEAGEMEDSLLVGDSGYPLSSYLLTPLDNPGTEAENLYNEAQIRTRNVIERTFGIWKRRFPILSMRIRCRLPLAQAIVVATAVLHNLACQNRDELPLEQEPEVNNQPPREAVVGGRQQDNAVRRTIIDYFQTLL